VALVDGEAAAGALDGRDTFGAPDGRDTAVGPADAGHLFLRCLTEHFWYKSWRSFPLVYMFIRDPAEQSS